MHSQTADTHTRTCHRHALVHNSQEQHRSSFLLVGQPERTLSVHTGATSWTTSLRTSGRSWGNIPVGSPTSLRELTSPHMGSHRNLNRGREPHCRRESRVGDANARVARAWRVLASGGCVRPALNASHRAMVSHPAVPPPRGPAEKHMNLGGRRRKGGRTRRRGLDTEPRLDSQTTPPERAHKSNADQATPAKTDARGVNRCDARSPCVDLSEN